jgi:DNA-binding NarL/FixJ family response regulator
MFNINQYQDIAEYFEAGFTCAEISKELDIELKTVVTYLSRYLSNKYHQLNKL